MLVLLEILCNECIHVGILHGIEIGHHLAERYIVHVVSEPHFCLYLVTVGNGHIVHLVAETDDAHILRVMPCSCNPFPYSDVLKGLIVLPVADHGLVVLAHACEDVGILAVSVCALVEVHEIHVDFIPRNLGIELGVQVEKRLLQDLKTVDPHLGRGECMHPGDDTDTFCLILCSPHYCCNLL